MLMMNFIAQLDSLKKVWDKRETQITTQEPQFYNWFQKHCAEVVKMTMLQNVRKSAATTTSILY